MHQSDLLRPCPYSPAESQTVGLWIQTGSAAVFGLSVSEHVCLGLNASAPSAVASSPASAPPPRSSL